MSNAVTLGIDVGGTSIKCALIESSGSLRDFRRVPTPPSDSDATATIALIGTMIAEYADAAPIAGVGLAVPGIVDDDAGRVIASANLGWRDAPIRDMLEAATGVRVVLGHDVRSGALAEAIVDDPAVGRTERGSVSIFIPIGTGIAAATVIDGSAVVSEGWAGEIGQVAVPMNPTRVGVTPLTLEGVASAASIARRIGCRDARTAASLVRAGDEPASVVWADAVDAIADALAWVTATVGADQIVIGGGLAESGELLLAPLREGLDARLGMLRRPRVTRARFGDRAAAIGAGLLAHRKETR